MRNLPFVVALCVTLALPALSIAKSLDQCFLDNIWYEQDGMHKDMVGSRYVYVAHCLCPTGGETAENDMAVACRKEGSGDTFVCYKGNQVSRTHTGSFNEAIAKSCQ